MTRLYEEELRKQQKRVEAECARRNEAAPKENECVVCMEAWSTSEAQLTYRAALMCGHQLCASCLFSPKFNPCRCPLCLTDINSARAATCKSVAESDASLRMLASNLPISSVQQIE
eukprot:3951590-Prymnesium_polylepis.1